MRLATPDESGLSLAQIARRRDVNQETMRMGSPSWRDSAIADAGHLRTDGTATLLRRYRCVPLSDGHTKPTVRNSGPMELRNLDDACTVLSALTREVTTSWAQDIQLYAAWVESPTSVCVVYERRIDEGLGLVYGQRVIFPPHVVKGDPTSTGEDVAQSLLEPPGDAFLRARKRNGVNWLWIQSDDDIPLWP